MKLGKKEIQDEEENSLSTFEKLAQKAKEREIKMRKILDKKYEKSVEELGLNPDNKLTKADARLLLELLGLELNEYQKNELDATLDRVRGFNCSKLKNWIIKNRNFILYNR